MDEKKKTELSGEELEQVTGGLGQLLNKIGPGKTARNLDADQSIDRVSARVDHGFIHDVLPLGD